MASPLHAAQEKQVQLQAKRTILLAEGSTATTEEIEALAAEIDANDRQILALKKLQDAERTAPAARQIVTATPRFEEDPKRGFGSIGEFAQKVKEAGDLARTGRGRVDERLAHAHAAAIADDADGGKTKIGATAPTTLQQEGNSTEGYMVPPEFRREIWRPAFEMDDLLAMVSPQVTASNSIQFYSDESTPWGAAGVVAYWVAEAAQITASKVPTKAGELSLDKIACLVYATDEILEDAPLLTSRINEAAPQAIGWAVGEAIMRGTGAGKPLGWENAACKVSVAKEGSQTATTIVAKNITKMYARLLTGPGAVVTWFANRDIVPELIDLKIGNEPSWVAQNQGLRDAPNGLLLGVPIRFSEHCKTLGTTGDIQLINLAGYAAYIKSGGTKFDSSIHLYFDYMISAFRWAMRVGGMPLLSAAVSPANGSNTKSHYVYLDTRS